MTPRHYPFGPLERWITANYRHPLTSQAKPSDSQVAELLGVCRQSIIRWRRNGLPERSADLAATRLGSHLDLLWPDTTT